MQLISRVAALAVLSAAVLGGIVSAADGSVTADSLPCAQWQENSDLDGADVLPDSKTILTLSDCGSASECRDACGEKCTRANYQRGTACAAATFIADDYTCTLYSEIKPDTKVVPLEGKQLFITCPEVNGLCTNAVTESLEEIESGICFNVLDKNVTNIILEYNPLHVDWRSFSRAIKKLGEKEPRFCSFVVRANFHDSGAIATTDVEVGTSASDGSLLLDAFEFLRPENAYDTFAAFVARILRRLAQYFGITLADALAVAHNGLLNSNFRDKLDPRVSLPHAVRKLSHLLCCMEVGAAGKLEAKFPFDKGSGAARVSNLPGHDASANAWMEFFLNKMNGAVKSEDQPDWEFTIDEALALMGSHTLIDNQACTTKRQRDGGCPGNAWDFFSWDKSTPKQRMFEWNNDYFKDGMSGSLRVRQKMGRSATSSEEEEAEACSFATKEAREVKKNLECKLRNAAQQLGIPLTEPEDDYRFVTWKPDGSRAECCGKDCDTCSWFDTYSRGKRWCRYNERGASFWPYTINDAFISIAAKERASTETSKLYDGYQSFKNSQVKFDEAYARALCKLNHIGSHYSELSKTAGGGKPVEITKSLLDECHGIKKNSDCDTDPDWKDNKLVIRKPNVCCQDSEPTCGQQKFNYFLNSNQVCSCNDPGEENDGELATGRVGFWIGKILTYFGKYQY